MAFPCALNGRYSIDYYDQSAPPVPVASQIRLPLQGRSGGSSVAVWLLDWGRVGLKTRSL
jgi:hypothetical protein